MTGEPTPWPTCPERGNVLGIELDCVLPELHDLDGQPEHETSDGMRWKITFTTHSGERYTLRGRKIADD
jgi:hypothetical protein